MTPEEVRLAVQQIIDRAPFTQADLADVAGISYDSLRSWAVGRRTPRDETKAKLARGLREKARELEALAAELERP